MRIASALLPALLPGAVLAQTVCPTADDLDSGIRFTLATGETEIFRRHESGLIEGLFDVGSGEVLRNLLGKGVYLLEASVLKDGVIDPASRLTYSYPLPPDSLPLPQPGGGWSVSVTLLEGTALSTEAQDYRFGAATVQGFGACSYAMIPITVRYPGVEGGQRDVVHYLPDLGISYLAEYHDSETNDIYVYTQIEAMR